MLPPYGDDVPPPWLHHGVYFFVVQSQLTKNMYFREGHEDIKQIRYQKLTLLFCFKEDEIEKRQIAELMLLSPVGQWQQQSGINSDELLY